MTNNVQIFEFKQSNIRTVEIEDEVWFVATDVANTLNLSNTTMALNRLDDDERSKFNLGRQGETNVISEAGLYRFIGGSRKKEAKQFMRWVNHEVLPSIRKHGAYLTNDKIEEILLSPDTLIKVATELKNEREKNVLLTQQVAESRPKADYYDKIMQSKSLVTITQIAKDYGWSAKQMNLKLHELGVQYKVGKQWVLYSKYQDKGYTFSHTVEIKLKDGSDDVRMNTKWTQKGRVFIYNLLKENDILPTIEREQ